MKIESADDERLPALPRDRAKVDLPVARLPEVDAPPAAPADAPDAGADPITPTPAPGP